ncbi:DUF1744-domain-containing protein, partial [Aureobasidium melanogenum]
VDGVQAEKVVNYTLPNGHPSVHLFKLSMPEQVYIKDADKLAALFNHSSVEGVYETQVPLDIRAVLELGSTCTFDEKQAGVLGRGMTHGFDLSALHYVAPKQPYLSSASMSYLYLYHVIAGERQIFALFCSSKKEAQIVVLNRSRADQGMPNVDRIYQDMFTKKLEENNGEQWQDVFEYQEGIHFKTVNVTTKKRALQEVGDAIKKIQKEETSPLMVVIQSQQPRLLRHDLPILQDLPMLPLKSDEDDKRLPPLGWQSFV